MVLPMTFAQIIAPSHWALVFKTWLQGTGQRILPLPPRHCPVSARMGGLDVTVPRMLSVLSHLVWTRLQPVQVTVCALKEVVFVIRAGAARIVRRKYAQRQ